ncbi:CLUMA_CG003610, isoform A [Clunio marinus]|uniref:CLUMA_CG003610, isoform A n=1 Tax=Clunio marinus TaxID=568069 RepID=A0A1J1HNQ0_9DIPT|nr:CLUMA_CG003610, isoform A [Clunio marinus]
MKKDFYFDQRFTVYVSVFAISFIATALALYTAAYNRLINSPTTTPEAIAIATFLLIVFVTVYSIYLIYFVIYLAAGTLLIRSVKRRTYANMMLYMVILVIGIIVSFLQLFSYSIPGVVVALLTLALNIYLLICIYSLYDLFRNEELNRVQRQQEQSQQPSSFNQPTVVYLQNEESNQQVSFQNSPTAPQLSPPVVNKKY